MLRILPRLLRIRAGILIGAFLILSAFGSLFNFSGACPENEVIRDHSLIRSVRYSAFCSILVAYFSKDIILEFPNFFLKYRRL
jgi:hypothetical protein